MPKLRLISHAICPYVQRAVIALLEKNAPFERTDIDLANRPDWFKRLSPLGKVPLLEVDGEVIFESAVICEYLDETIAPRLHPEDALQRARHRAWIEFGSTILVDLWQLNGAPDAQSLEAKTQDLRSKFGVVEQALGDGPYFAGEHFSLVDAAFAPALRFFDLYDQIADFGVFADAPKVRAWREALAARPSVKNAVAANYPERLEAAIEARGSEMARRIAAAG